MKSLILAIAFLAGSSAMDATFYVGDEDKGKLDVFYRRELLSESMSLRQVHSKSSLSPSQSAGKGASKMHGPSLEKSGKASSKTPMSGKAMKKTAKVGGKAKGASTIAGMKGSEEKQGKNGNEKTTGKTMPKRTHTPLPFASPTATPSIQSEDFTTIDTSNAASSSAGQPNEFVAICLTTLVLTWT